MESDTVVESENDRIEKSQDNDISKDIHDDNANCKNGISAKQLEDCESEKISHADLENKIIRQIEYYFGNYNLPRDKFLKEEIKKDDGWISLETLIKFRRLASLTTDFDVILTALQKSTSGLIEVDAENKKIRRALSKLLPEYNKEVKAESIKRTVYFKGFPKASSVTLDKLLDFFEPHGPFETVHMRNFTDQKTKKSGFKGSVLVVCKSEDKAKELMEKESLVYNKLPLIRKWYSDYLKEKTKEYEERQALRESKKKQKEEDNQIADEELCEGFEKLPKGTFLHFCDVPDGVSREDLSLSLGILKEACCFVDFAIGSTEGYFRFKGEDSNKDAFDKLGGVIKVKEREVKLRIVDEEEDEKLLAKANRARIAVRTNTLKRKLCRGGGGGNRGGKRRRH